MVRQPHAGIGALAATYNAAVARSRGEYVAIREGDDFWPPDKLEVQVGALESSGAVLASGPTLMVDEGGSTIQTVPGVLPRRAGLTNDPIGSAAVDLLHPSHLTFTFPVSTVVRRSALLQIGGFQSRPYLAVVDLPTFVALASVGPFVWVDSVSGHWRRHAASTTSGYLPAILDGAYHHVQEWLRSSAPALGVPLEDIKSCLLYTSRCV